MKQTMSKDPSALLASADPVEPSPGEAEGLAPIPASRSLARVITLASFLLLALWLALKFLFAETYVQLIREDGVLEMAQFFSYLAAGLGALLVALRFRRAQQSLLGAAYLVLALGLFFVAMEEVSWTQNFLDFETPDYVLERNTQEELNLHNLDTVQPVLHYAYILVGAFGAFAWLAVPRRRRDRELDPVWFVVPGPTLMLLFLPVVAVYGYFELLAPLLQAWFEADWLQPRIRMESEYFGGGILWRDQEPAELLLSLGFLGFVLLNLARQSRLLRAGGTSLSRR